jgi:hypothetical protein
MPPKKPSTKKSPPKKPRVSSAQAESALRITGITAAERRNMALWQAQDDLRVLRASQEIANDSGRMKRAQALIEQEIKALRSVKPGKAV